MSDINITTTNRNVLVTDPGIAVTIESNVIDVEVTGGRGPAGVAPTPSYLVYTALLMQTGTNAPVATVLENTLGQEIIYNYTGVGLFGSNDIIGVASSKIWVIITSKYNFTMVQANEHNTGGPSSIYIEQRTLAGVPINGIAKAYIEIRVYP